MMLFLIFAPILPICSQICCSTQLPYAHIVVHLIEYLLLFHSIDLLKLKFEKFAMWPRQEHFYGSLWHVYRNGNALDYWKTLQFLEFELSNKANISFYMEMLHCILSIGVSNKLLLMHWYPPIPMVQTWLLKYIQCVRCKWQKHKLKITIFLFYLYDIKC